MLIAHVPSGYLLARGTAWRMAPCLIGAMFPDIDMLRFWVTGGHVHHHAYFTHIPAFWAAVSLVLLVGQWRPLALPFLAGVWLHLLMDTWAGDILWLWPISDRFFHVVGVPAAHGHWITSFILHWTFLPEIAITLTAAFEVARRRRTV